MREASDVVAYWNESQMQVFREFVALVSQEARQQDKEDRWGKQERQVQKRLRSAQD